jgi:hypothetical protein
MHKLGNFCGPERPTTWFGSDFSTSHFYRALTLVIILVTRTDKLAALIISQLFENLTIIIHRFFSQPLVIVRILPTAGYQL